MEDADRKESEARLRNKTNSKYLDDVKHQTSEDYDEAIETIEREKMRVDSMESGFLSSLDLSVHEKRNDFDDKAARIPKYSDPNAGRQERARNINTLLESCDRLLKISHKTNSAINSGPHGTTDFAALDKVRKADQDHVKDVLAAGKRVFENDLDAVDRNTAAKLPTKGNHEAMEQAQAVFGGRKNAYGDADGGKALKYMAKGVKKMTKGLESDR